MDYYFVRERDGRREVSWRVWLLIWLLPGLFGLAAAWLAFDTAVRLARYQPATGEVVRVYDWPDEAPWAGPDDRLYAPVFRYTWSDGAATEASAGLSRRAWNLPLGSRHAILFDPYRKADVMLPGPHNWIVPGVIAAIALVLVAPAFYVHRRVRRWQRRDP